jgi:hypothetical protein
VVTGERNFSPAFIATVNGTLTGNSFDQRFAATGGNPLVEPGDTQQDFAASADDQADVDRGVSNVLSLAERVRSLQNGVKKS